jgi:hypothetical protein
MLYTHYYLQNAHLRFAEVTSYSPVPVGLLTEEVNSYLCYFRSILTILVPIHLTYICGL